MSPITSLKYKHGEQDLLSFAMMPPAELTLPRYQRAGGQWDVRDKLGFAMSVMFRFPTGYTTLKLDNKGKKWLIDGRQRRETIRDLLNPYELSRIIKSAVPKSWKDGSGKKYYDWGHRICSFGKGWLKTYHEHDFKEHYDGWLKLDLENACKDRGLSHAGKKNKELIQQLADSDAETGAALEKQYQNDLAPLLKLVDTLAAFGGTSRNPDTGFGSIYRTKPAAWGAKATGPETSNIPFFKPSTAASGFTFSSKEFGEHLLQFFHDEGWDPLNCVDTHTFVSWAQKKWPTVDKAVLTKQWNLKNKTLGHPPLFEALDEYKRGFNINQIGVITLECETHEAMKIFHLINASGVQLSEVQVLASWPDWNKLVFKSGSSPSPNPDLVKVVQELYDAQAIPYNLGEISRWDIAATVVDRLAHNEIWGGDL